MRSIKTLAPKPSDALRAMVDGLLEGHESKDFEIYMGSFGHFKLKNNKPICIGCCATVALQKIGGSFLPWNLIRTPNGRANFFGFDEKETTNFEFAINSVRVGVLETLFQFYYPNEEDFKAQKIDRELFYIDRFHMTSYDWEQQIPLVESHIVKLKASGY